MPRIPVINTSHLDRIDELLVDNIDTGEFKLHRSVFTDEALFDLEMKYIFEGNWVYLAHESQIPNNNDYYTTHIGRQPVIIARNRNGELNAMINACSPGGAQLCRHKRVTKQHIPALSTAGRLTTQVNYSRLKIQVKPVTRTALTKMVHTILKKWLVLRATKVSYLVA